jgi:hypothetical protein
MFSSGREVPNTIIVRSINPTARLYGIEITDLFVLMAGIPVCLVAASFLPAVDIPIDLAGFLGGRRLPNPPKISLVPLVPGVFFWIMLSLLYLIFRKYKTVSYLKDFWREVNEGVERLNGINPNLWELGPDDIIDEYLIAKDQEKYQ